MTRVQHTRRTLLVERRGVTNIRLKMRLRRERSIFTTMQDDVLGSGRRDIWCYFALRASTNYLVYWGRSSSGTFHNQTEWTDMIKTNYRRTDLDPFRARNMHCEMISVLYNPLDGRYFTRPVPLDLYPLY
jgi:hypothetical protein